MTIRRPRLIAALLLTATFAALVPLSAGSQEAGRRDASRDLAKDLVGTWILVGTPEKVGDAPERGGRLKFFTGTQWCITQADPTTGEVVFHHGGTYSLDGDTLTSTVRYANQSTADRIGRTSKFRITVEGDRHTSAGIDNDFDEVWRRVK